MTMSMALPPTSLVRLPMAQRGIFNVDIGFAHQAQLVMSGLSRSPHCACCGPVPPPALQYGQQGGEGCNVLRLRGDPASILAAGHGNLGSALLEVFGEEGLWAIFGRADAVGAQLLHCGGMNHVFMVAHAGRLAKCVRPALLAASEVGAASRLLRSSPGIAWDAHAVFPLAAFVCGLSEGSGPGPPYEVLVFEHLDGCSSVKELIRMFERTHQFGPLQRSSVCAAYRDSGTCDHLQQLESLLARQVPLLNRRFQRAHQRRHGDYKADNLLVGRGGVLRLVDFLCPFCTSCDLEEFLSSTNSMHTGVQQLRAAAIRAWQVPWTGSLSLECALTPEDVAGNGSLVASLRRLVEAQQEQPLFGPMPSLLNQIQWPSISLAFAGQLPSPVQSRQSAPLSPTARHLGHCGSFQVGLPSVAAPTYNSFLHFEEEYVYESGDPWAPTPIKIPAVSGNMTPPTCGACNLWAPAPLRSQARRVGAGATPQHLPTACSFSPSGMGAVGQQSWFGGSPGGVQTGPLRPGSLVAPLFFG